MNMFIFSFDNTKKFLNKNCRKRYNLMFNFFKCRNHVKIKLTFLNKLI